MMKKNLTKKKCIKFKVKCCIADNSHIIENNEEHV